MLTITRLFGKSPFTPLKAHMEKVALCVSKLPFLFDNLSSPKESSALAAEIASLEHQADLTKNDIRNHLRKSLFLPIDKRLFLELLSFQDLIADTAEHTAITATLKPLEFQEEFLPLFLALVTASIETFHGTKKIIEEIEELLESSFGGLEAEKIRQMVEKVAHKEHIAKEKQQLFLKALFNSTRSFSVASFIQWERLADHLLDLARFSEKLANKVRMLLETK